MHSVRKPVVLGFVLMLCVVLTACAGEATETRPTVTPTTPTGESGSTQSDQQSPSPDAGAPVEEIEVRVENGEPDPTPGRVEVPVGSTVRLTVTSDVADEVHVHTYEEEITLRPGNPGSVEFTADIPGLFEVEMHESGTVLFSLQVS